MEHQNTNPFDLSTTEVASFLQAGDIDAAVRTSGELLAACDNELRRLYNEQKPLGLAIEKFISAAILHVHCLRAARSSGDAFSCSVATLLTVEIFRQSGTVDSLSKVRLYDFATRSAIDCFDSMGDAIEPEQENHRGFILSYLASLLYFYYTQAIAEKSESAVLNDVYKFLKAISGSGAIQSPTIKLGDKDVSPDNAGPLLIDIMSRAAALGIYS